MCSQEFKLSPKKVSQLRYTLSILVINKNSSNNIKTCTDKKKKDFKYIGKQCTLVHKIQQRKGLAAQVSLPPVYLGIISAQEV